MDHYQIYLWTCYNRWYPLQDLDLGLAPKMGKVRESERGMQCWRLGVAYGCVSIYISLAESHSDKNKQIDRSSWEVAEPKRDLFCIQIIITASLVAFWNFPLCPLHTSWSPRSVFSRTQIPHSLPPSFIINSLIVSQWSARWVHTDCTIHSPRTPPNRSTAIKHME